MTGPLFPFETRLHRDALSVHRPHHASVADPATTNPEGVKAWHIWWQVDSDTTPTKYKAWLRNPGNTAWIFLYGWWLDETYSDGQVPVADVDGYFLPGDAGGAESAGPIDGLGTAGLIAKWADSNTLEDSSLDENTSDITSTKPVFLPAGTTSVPSLRVPHGSAPTTPTNGDLWSTTAGFFGQVNGSTVGPFSAGGSGGGWTQVVDEDGTSFANFTIIDGSWSSDGTTINFAGDGANRRTCRYTARVPHSTIYLWEAEILIPASPGGSGEGGLSAQLATTWGANANSQLKHDGATGTSVATDTGNVANRETTTLAWGAFDEWHKLSMLMNIGGVEVFADGTWVHGTLDGALIGTAPTPKLYVGLTAIRPAKYRNIKLYRLALPGE